MLPFLTAFDPLGGSSGSIDPLGALQTYGLLADMLLPGVTTITTRSRYLSMLSAALANAERYQRFLPGASGLAQRRRAVEPYERLWALACVAAKFQGINMAAEGLRGVTRAEKHYWHLANNGRPLDTDFKLLKYQSRTGAVGTYWTAMIGGELADPDTGTLSAEGRELAEQFPAPHLSTKDLQRLADPDLAHRVTVPMPDLVTWAEQCHLVAAGDEERSLLGDALTADDRRDRMSHALSELAKADGLPESWNIPSLKRLRHELNHLPTAVKLGLTTVIDAIVATEQFHEAVLAVFQTLLWWGTCRSSKPVDDLFLDSEFQTSTDRCRETAMLLRRFRDTCERTEIREAVTGLTSFGIALERCESPRTVVEELMRRHRQIQSGKMTGGVPKRDWIAFDGMKLLRPSGQFQRNDRPPLADGKNLTHPYRLEPFIHMLRENDVLPK